VPINVQIVNMDADDRYEGYESPQTSDLSDYELSQMPTKKRLDRAVRYFNRHPMEKQSDIAKRYQVNPRSLSNRLSRQHIPKKKNRGQNIGLTPAQEVIVLKFINSYLEHNMNPTRGVIFAFITNLRKRDNKPTLSTR